MMEQQDILQHYYQDWQENFNQPEPNWLRTFRQQQINYFVSKGFPSKKNETWKYTNLSPIKKILFKRSTPTSFENIEKIKQKMLVCTNRLVFVDGYFQAELSSTNGLEGIIVCNLATALDKYEPLLQSILTQATESCPFSHLNAAYLQDGALVVLPENFQMQQPLHLLFLSTTSNLQNSRNIIIAEQNARGHIFEEHLSFSDQVYFANVQTQIIAKESSCLSYSKLQQQNLNSFHIANVQIHQAKESQVQVQHYSLGSKLARENINSFLEAKGASIDLKGLFLPLNQQHIDINLNIDHLADATSSEASFKGVAAHKSVAVFNGKIEVSDHIKQAIANLQNKNLLLTSDAEINTKPELKIYSNDVKCKHGATIGQIDQQMLFYLRSRGIGAQQAYQLLLLAFIREQLNCLSDNLVTNKIVSAINQVCEEITL